MTASEALHEVSVNAVKEDENKFSLCLSKECYVYIKDVLIGLEEFNSASLMGCVKND